MNSISVALIVLGVISIILGLLLAGSGSSTGLTALNGYDLELFKKTKDRGFIKILQIIFLLVLLTMLILIILNSCFGWVSVEPEAAEETEEETAAFIFSLLSKCS